MDIRKTLLSKRLCCYDSRSSPGNFFPLKDSGTLTMTWLKLVVFFPFFVQFFFAIFLTINFEFFSFVFFDFQTRLFRSFLDKTLFFI